MIALPLLGVEAATFAADVSLVDDSGRTVTFSQPARRIISLAPHVTELLYAAGAGDRLVGAVDYSDYPPPAKRIPRVGSSTELDLERIMALRPDLIIVWLHGSTQRQLDQLVHLGIPVFYSEPHRLEDIAQSIERFGRLAGTENVASREAQSFRMRLAKLRMQYVVRAPIRVFYQVWQKPLLTINGKHIISDVIGMCGGQNVFAGLDSLVPEISIEAVLSADPEVIVTAEVATNSEDSLDVWRHWPHLAATQRHNFFRIPEDLISRHTPRILDGALLMCEDLDAARAKRSQ